jgi:hypothetical protein
MTNPEFEKAIEKLLEVQNAQARNLAGIIAVQKAQAETIADILAAQKAQGELQKVTETKLQTLIEALASEHANGHKKNAQ